MTSTRCFVIAGIFALIPASVFAQFHLYDTVAYKPRRLVTFSAAAASTYTVGMIGLHELWYKESAREDFHFFNDNREWLQVDKVGHFYSAFYLSALTAKGVNTCGVSPAGSALTGALVGFGSLLLIEVFDGYSASYGASAGDLMANAGGSLFYWIQQRAWNDIRFQPKFSFHPTSYAARRPALLGNSLVEELFKDYNGQTYWITADMDKFCRFPAWLNVSVGYGAHGMVYAREPENSSAGYDARRQFYLSVDLDFSAVHTQSRLLRTLLDLASLLKFPAPALEFSKTGFKFHPAYF